MSYEGAKATREAVYNCIDGERDYQDKHWGSSKSDGIKTLSGQPGGIRTTDEFILYITGYAQQLHTIGSTSADPAKKLDTIRKVAALCVAAMEQHGTVERKE